MPLLGHVSPLFHPRLLSSKELPNVACDARMDFLPFIKGKTVRQELDQLQGIRMSDVEEVLQLDNELRLLPLMTLRRPVVVLLQHLPLLDQLMQLFNGVQLFTQNRVVPWGVLMIILTLR